LADVFFRAFTEIRICGFRQNQGTASVSFLTSDNSPALLFFYGCDGLRIVLPCTERGSCASAIRVSVRGEAPMTLPLVTEEERARLLAHGAARAAGQARPAARGALFTPDAHATWLLAALDPADGDTAYGLIDLGIGMPELGR
jgi:hypothetical protein